MIEEEFTKLRESLKRGKILELKKNQFYDIFFFWNEIKNSII